VVTSTRLQEENAMSDPVEVVSQKPQPVQGVYYSPSSIVLYGVPVFADTFVVGYSNEQIDVLTFALAGANPPPVPYIVALIYGYEYQGHCYSLPEPMHFAVPNAAGIMAPAVGCGYDGAAPFNYMMWRVDKLERTVQLHLSNDTFEELVLRRAIAGARPPLSYRSTAILAHRGGQLVEK
jgi:hypothetical protein